MNTNIQKMKLLPKITQAFIFSKIATFGTDHKTAVVVDHFWHFLELVNLTEISK